MSKNEIIKCQFFGKLLGMNFDEDTIEIMLKMIENGMDFEQLSTILLEIKFEIEKINNGAI